MQTTTTASSTPYPYAAFTNFIDFVTAYRRGDMPVQDLVDATGPDHDDILGLFDGLDDAALGALFA